MSGREVGILRTGVANVASVVAAFERIGARPILVENGAAVTRAHHLVFPGVGSYGAAMERLDQDGLGDAVRERIAADRPTLAICLGLQLLFEGSEESAGLEGLGVVQGIATRFPDTVRVPQFGWNRVDVDPACTMLQPGHAYFANSYRVEDIPPGWLGATAQHGGSFVAAMERGSTLACQFHPELSGPWGMQLLARWLGLAE